MDIYTIENEEAARVGEEPCEALFPERMKKARRYLRYEDRLMCMGAGLLLTCCAGEREADISLNKYGKPYSRSGRFFSLSHSDGCAAIAFGGSELGTDIEGISSENLKLAPLVFCPEEREWIKADPPERFYRLWSIKESILKAAGLGMSVEPVSLCVDPETDSLAFDGRIWYYRSAVWKNRSVAAACSEPFSELHIIPLDAAGIMRLIRNGPLQI